jgi:hypothetical protein
MSQVFFIPVFLTYGIVNSVTSKILNLSGLAVVEKQPMLAWLASVIALTVQTYLLHSMPIMWVYGFTVVSTVVASVIYYRIVR